MRKHIREYSYNWRKDGFFEENFSDFSERLTRYTLWGSVVGLMAGVGGCIVGGWWIVAGIGATLVSLGAGLRAAYIRSEASCTLNKDFTYVDGLIHGWYRTYHNNGRLAKKIKYRAGVQEGGYYQYHENGDLAEKYTTHAGKIDGPYISFYRSGQLEKKCTYKDGDLDGPYIEYYDNGNIDTKCTYKNGYRDGPFVCYYEGGTLSKKCTYKDGKEDGLYETYNEDGQLMKRAVYRDGVELQGTEAEVYLKTVQHAQIIQEMDKDSRIIDLRDRLAHLTDKKYYKAIGKARTPERKRKVIDLMHMRRGAELVARVLHRAKAEGDEKMVTAVSKIAEPIRAEESALRKEFSRKRRLMKIARRHNEGKQG